jgi:hypothetical protein
MQVNSEQSFLWTATCTGSHARTPDLCCRNLKAGKGDVC